MRPTGGAGAYVQQAARACALGLALALLPLGPAVAQLPELGPGARIRIRAPGEVAGRLEGVVIDRGPDTIRVAPRNAAPIPVPIAAITSLELNRGPSGRAGALKGAKWGAAIGLGFGLLNVVFSDCGGRYCEAGYKAGGVAMFTAVSAGVGAGIGALRKADRWEEVPVPRAAPAPGVQRRDAPDDDGG